MLKPWKITIKSIKGRDKNDFVYKSNTFRQTIIVVYRRDNQLIFFSSSNDRPLMRSIINSTAAIYDEVLVNPATETRKTVALHELNRFRRLDVSMQKAETSSFRIDISYSRGTNFHRKFISLFAYRSCDRRAGRVVEGFNWVLKFLRYIVFGNAKIHSWVTSDSQVQPGSETSYSPATRATREQSAVVAPPPPPPWNPQNGQNCRDSGLTHDDAEAPNVANINRGRTWSLLLSSRLEQVITALWRAAGQIRRRLYSYRSVPLPDRHEDFSFIQLSVCDSYSWLDSFALASVIDMRQNVTSCLVTGAGARGGGGWQAVYTYRDVNSGVTVIRDASQHSSKKVIVKAFGRGTQTCVVQCVRSHKSHLVASSTCELCDSHWFRGCRNSTKTNVQIIYVFNLRKNSVLV